MKVSVKVSVIYDYEVDVPDGASLEDYCDAADPVFYEIAKSLRREGIDYYADFISIVDNETGEVLLVGE